MLLIWFVVCFTGLVGNIANAAHTLGLIVGVIAGWLPPSALYVKKLLQHYFTGTVSSGNGFPRP